MPLSKRLKDSIRSYVKLKDDYDLASQVLNSADVSYNKAKNTLIAKMDEIIREAESCLGESFRDKAIEIDGCLYVIDTSFKSDLTRFFSCIREIKVEK